MKSKIDERRGRRVPVNVKTIAHNTKVCMSSETKVIVIGVE